MIKFRCPIYRPAQLPENVRVRHMVLKSRIADVEMTMFVRGPITLWAHAPLAQQIEKVVYELAAEDAHDRELRRQA